MELAARGAILVGEILAGRASEVGRARAWLDVGGAILQGMSSPHPVLEAWRLQGMAIVQQKAGDVDGALRAGQRALALLEQAYGPEHPDISINLTNIGLTLAESRRFQEALTYYRRAEEVGRKVGGPDHILVGLAVFNEAEALNGLGRYDEARATSERALAIWRRAGSRPLYEGSTLAVLGQSLLGMGRLSEAVSQLEQARTLLGDEPSTYQPEVRFVLARALWTSPDKRRRALALAREAEAGYQRLGATATASEVGAWLRTHHARPEVAAAP